MKKPTARLWSNLKNRWERFGGWERANREAGRDREKEGETRDETWSLKDERGERLENKSWRTPRDLADAASGKSHRSMTEEQEGEKKQSTGFGLPPRDPLRRHL